MKLYIVIGRGGVGKTTCAAALGLLASVKGPRTLVVSLDPAHNLGDVLQVKLTDKPAKVRENLYALEVNYDKTVLRYLENLTRKLRDLYRHLQVLNLDKHIDILKYTPGVEEHAVLDQMHNLLREYSDYDIVIVDTPPTGLTLRVLALPFIGKIWIEKLIELRKLILEKRRAISRILGEKPRVKIGDEYRELPVEEHEDPVLRELLEVYREYSEITSTLQDRDKTRTVLVLNPETLPVIEGLRAREVLSKLNIEVTYVVVNKVIQQVESSSLLRVKLCEQEKNIKIIESEFKNVRCLVKIPLLDTEPTGIDRLSKVCMYLEKLLD